jgi:peptidoglycan glycosyltransferase
VNRSVRRLAGACLVALLVVTGGLTYQQAVAGPGYRDDVRNPRALADRASRERGSIVTADGVTVARSEPDPRAEGDLIRVYPEQGLYAHAVGYASSYFGDTGLEATHAEELRSGDDGSLTSALFSFFGGDLRPHQLRLTIRDDLQRAAAAALGDQHGAVVALDPATGAILALVSNPTFDPNILASGDAAQGDALAADPEEPLLNRVTSATYPPGSSFKVLVTAAGLQASLVTRDTRFSDRNELELPGSTAVIRNADGGYCADGVSLTLERALAVSCNTAFAELGMLLGLDPLLETVQAAGFNQAVPFDLGTIASVFPSEGLAGDLPALAQTALGQRDVRATPLQMALVAAGVANRGLVMRPYLVDAVLDADGNPISHTLPAAWRRAMTEATADDLAAMMEQVVTSGTGGRAAVPGVRIAGKTGTAEVPDAAPHVWFIGLGPVEPEPGEPQIAVAVLVESGGNLGESASGGSVAAPIAQAVLAAFFSG